MEDKKEQKTLRVKATEVGFYGEMRKPGDIFMVKERHRKASWYTPVAMLDQLDNPEAKGSDEDSGVDDLDELDLEDDDGDLAGD